MIRFLAHTLMLALLMPIYLSWSKKQSELQIDKMQRAVFNTPGSEAPVPLRVMIGGALLVGGHFFFGNSAFRLKIWQIALTTLLGSIGGIALFLVRTARR